MGGIMLAINLAIAILLFKGIYAMSNSVILSIIGTLILGGAFRSAPIFVLFVYPFIEFISIGRLSIYSYIIFAISIVQMLVIFIEVKRAQTYSEPFITEWEDMRNDVTRERDDEIARALSEEWSKKRLDG